MSRFSHFGVGRDKGFSLQNRKRNANLRLVGYENRILQFVGSFGNQGFLPNTLAGLELRFETAIDDFRTRGLFRTNSSNIESGQFEGFIQKYESVGGATKKRSRGTAYNIYMTS